MDKFKELIASQLMNKQSNQNIEKIQYLLKAFPNSKEILRELDDQFHKKSDLNNEYKNKFLNLLKASWLKVWKIHGLEIEDVAYVKKYLKDYTPNQKRDLNEKLEKLTGEKLQPEIKNLKPLTQALQNYRKGFPQELDEFVENSQGITFTDYMRICSLIENSHFQDATLPIFLKAFEKLTQNHLHEALHIDSITLLVQPKEHFNQYVQKHVGKKGIFKNPLEILNLTSWKLSDKSDATERKKCFDGWGRLMVGLTSYDNKKILNAFINIETIMNYGETFLHKIFKNTLPEIKKLRGIDIILNQKSSIENYFEEMSIDISKKDLSQAFYRVSSIRLSQMLPEAKTPKSKVKL